MINYTFRFLVFKKCNPFKQVHNGGHNAASPLSWQEKSDSGKTHDHCYNHP